MAIEKVKKVSRPKIGATRTITPRANTSMNQTAKPRLTGSGMAAKTFAAPLTGATATKTAKPRGTVAELPVVKKKYSVK